MEADRVVRSDGSPFVSLLIGYSELEHYRLDYQQVNRGEKTIEVASSIAIDLSDDKARELVSQISKVLPRRRL